MRLLLDTHAILWWLSDDRRLGTRAREIIEDPGSDVIISVVSLWEMVVKTRVGKLQADIAEVIRALETEAFEFLGVLPAHLRKLAALPAHHRDPFDHLLIAQSLAENIIFMTDDQHASLYPVQQVRCSDAMPPTHPASESGQNEP